MLENHENYLVLKEKCLIMGIEYVSLIALHAICAYSSEHNWLPLFFGHYIER